MPAKTKTKTKTKKMTAADIDAMTAPLPGLDQEASAYSEDPLGLGFDLDETAPAIPRGAVIKEAVQEQIAQANAARFADVHQPAIDAMAEEAAHVGADATVAAVIAQLQAEIKHLKSQTQALTQRAAAEEAQGEGGLPFMYYKRPTDGGPASGWIVCASGGVGPVSGGRDVGSYSVLLGKGFKPLPRYGITGSPASHHGRPGHEYTVFLNNGGGVDVPAAQVLALKWHVNCPVPGTKFPQYDKAVDAGLVQHFACDEGDCDFDLWFLRDDQTTAGACMAHLRAQHAYKHEEARAVLKEMGVFYRSSRVAEAVVAARRVQREFLELEE
mgnify:CR=1 FL=1